MLYTIFLLLSGIYIGQEYAIIPSVRIIGRNLLVYLNTLRIPDENEEGSYYERFRRYLRQIR